MKTFKQFLESVEPLVAVQIEMFFRKELDLSKEEAKEATLWIEEDKDWGDLEGDTRDHILDYVVAIVPHLYDLPSRKIEERAFEELANVMYAKYEIEL
jgi:hypothetical protein